MSSIYGSMWSKWDLHIHNPYSTMNNNFSGSTIDEKWESYISKIEEFDDISVIGITDYFSIKGYKKILEYKNNGRLPRINLILPNIELRILPVTDRNRAINLHILFAPSIIQEFENRFFSNLKFEYNGNKYTCTEPDLIQLGRKYRNDPLLVDGVAFRDGIEQFKITIDDIKGILNENKTIRDNCLIGVSNSNNDGNSGIQHSGVAAVREEIYRFADFILSSNPNDREYFLGKGTDSVEECIRKFGRLKPCIHGSDAHSLADLFKPFENRYTWIKSDTTFEGLRQIVYEPEYRVIIQNEAKIPPPIRIDTVNLTFPNNSYFDNNKFCFSNEREIKFSPYFTCLIGGRGTGKSTLLNLIHESLNPGENEFFKDKKITDENGNQLDIENCVSVDNNTEAKFIDFLSQNEVEEFAKDYKKLTKSIYARLMKLDEGNIISNAEDELIDNINNINAIAKLIIKKDDLTNEQKVKTKEIETYKKIIDSIKSQEYQSLTESVKELNLRLQNLQSSKEKYELFVNYLTGLLSNYPKSEVTNLYDELVNKIIDAINELIKVDANTFTEAKLEIEDLTKQLVIERKKLEEFLANKGLNKENLKDITDASEKVQLLEKETEILTKQIANVDSKINGFSLDELKDSSDRYKNQLETLIQRISHNLETLNTQFVRPISLSLEFDDYLAREDLFNKFKEMFSSNIDQYKFREYALKEILIPQNIFDVTKEEILDGIKNNSSASNAKDFLIELFKNENHLNIFFLLINSSKHNYSLYKKIQVKYDNRDIQNTSFGQRCTAALVILLLLGNNPIIIDEPEAHLDSLLISNYLVEVIKAEKQNRQIIFATHNANFVVNGDCELIHILTIDTNNYTVITPTTIENDSTRSELISLEGGVEAFKRREYRYHC